MHSETVANQFLVRSFDSGTEISVIKLIKLVYLAHGWHRVYFSRNLISDPVIAGMGPAALSPPSKR